MVDSTSAASNPPPAEGATPSTSRWEERVRAFAEAVGKTVEVINEALVKLTGPANDDAVIVLADPNALTDEDLKEVLVKTDPPGIPLGLFRKHLPLLRGPLAVAPTSSAERTVGPSFDVLPQVPDDTSFLEMLKTGGILKVGKTEAIAGTKAALAQAVGVFDLPSIILKRMEQFAEEQEEPVGENFFRLQKLVTEKNYGEVLSALGVPGHFVSQARKQALLERLKSGLWPALRSFNDQLNAWQDTWTAGMANPGVILAALAFGQGGRGMMPPGMVQAPDTSSIRDAADAVVDRINRVFAGVGIPVARALAHDATRIKSVLEDPALPVALGAANREQMLKLLKVNVSSDYVRLEQNITRYVLAIVELSKVTAGNEEYAYLAAMIQLGAAIPWDKLPAGSDIPNGGRIASPRRKTPSGVGLGRGSGDDDEDDNRSSYDGGVGL